MEILKTLNRRDHAKAIDFAIVGMNFRDYTDSPLMLKLYGRHFFYTELNRATHIFTCYEGDTLRGVLLAHLDDSPVLPRSLWRTAYTRVFGWLLKTFAPDSNSSYDSANRAMLKEYKKKYNPDGEIVFFAADPTARGKGIGTRLLDAFSQVAAHREIYLYTDSNCSYQFYERRGFERVGEKDISVGAGKDKAKITCLMYRKQLG